MTITEKAAYLRGLVEGQEMDSEAGEGKLWRVLSELVSDLAAKLSELQDDHEELAESVSNLEEEVDFLGEFMYDMDDDADTDDDSEAYYPFRDFYSDDEDEENTDDEDMEVTYEVECPNCGESFSFDAVTLEAGSVPCPNCGTSLEFEIPDQEE